MQNRFGLKDFVLLAVLLATLGSVWLSMVQQTRTELAQQDAKAKLAEIEQQVAQLSRKVEKGFEQLPQAALDAAAAGGGRAEPQASPAADARARPGVKVERWPSLNRARGLMWARIQRPCGSTCQPSASAPSIFSVFGLKAPRLSHTRSMTRVA
ncbi:MAG: hypothetical protein ACKOTD_05160 [Phycisphaerales bacterium]